MLIARGGLHLQQVKLVSKDARVKPNRCCLWSNVVYHS